MDVIGQFLDARDERKAQVGSRTRWIGGWIETHYSPEERLIRFDRWVRARLNEHLDWTWAGDQRERRIEQCRIHLERLVLDLWRRGWLLDGTALATHIEKVLIAVGLQQRAGKVQSFWPYFQGATNRYVGVNSEEIRDEAMRAGSHMSQLMATIGRVQRSTLPELIAQRASEVAKGKKEATLRERLAVARKQAKTAAAADGQLPLI